MIAGKLQWQHLLKFILENNTIREDIKDLDIFLNYRKYYLTFDLHLKWNNFTFSKTICFQKCNLLLFWHLNFDF